MNRIIQGDCLEAMKTLEPDSVDAVITDPPYGYSFMGKDWDKAVPSVDTWKECLRVLKPGAFACVMSAPRSDVQMHMIQNLTEAGFRLDFTPIYWTYASGFPKAGNIGKMVDKRLGAEREVTGRKKEVGGYKGYPHDDDSWQHDKERALAITAPSTQEAKALDGSYAGFQPKPAVEVIIIAMKPLSEKTFVDQALKNGKGITWLDDCRVPTDTPQPIRQRKAGSEFGQNSDWNDHKNVDTEYDPNKGRFPANLLVSDDVLNDGSITKPSYRKGDRGYRIGIPGELRNKSGQTDAGYPDSGSYSRYFDLDKWASTLPFLIVPKASKGEKNKGLEDMEEKETTYGSGGGAMPSGNSNEIKTTTKNHHPTVKPLKLMSYLVTLFSREGDTVLDPFLGSGTTALAARKLSRKYIGIELNQEYVEIAQARLDDKQEALF